MTTSARRSAMLLTLLVGIALAACSGAASSQPASSCWPGLQTVLPREAPLRSIRKSSTFSSLFWRTSQARWPARA